MGFDLYGMNPTINKKYPKRYDKMMKKYGNGEFLDWSKDIPENIKEDYFEIKQQYENDNPGDYFRNNVWWWRPLWKFVCTSCYDILTDKDMEHGSYNDGHSISKTKATRIGKRLSKLIADGTVDKVDREEALKVAKSKAHNEIVQEQLDKIDRECKNALGDNNIVPAHYPEPFKSRWHKEYTKKQWASDYPFDKGNVKDFAIFCLQSGGFEIC